MTFIGRAQEGQFFFCSSEAIISLLVIIWLKLFIIQGNCSGECWGWLWRGCKVGCGTTRSWVVLRSGGVGEELGHCFHGYPHQNGQGASQHWSLKVPSFPGAKGKFCLHQVTVLVSAGIELIFLPAAAVFWI